MRQAWTTPQLVALDSGLEEKVWSPREWTGPITDTEYGQDNGDQGES